MMNVLEGGLVQECNQWMCLVCIGMMNSAEIGIREILLGGENCVGLIIMGSGGRQARVRGIFGTWILCVW